MSDSGIGFGGFLLGLGAGWYIFQYIDIGFDSISYLLILMGVGMILSGLLTKGGKKHPISGIIGGVIGGLFLAAILLQGFNFVFTITDEFTDFSDAPYRVTQGFTMNTDLTGDELEFDIDSVNGGVTVNSWSGDSVKWDIEVKAKGNTNAEAEERLQDFEYDLTTESDSGVQTISLSFPLSNSEWSNYAVFIELYVPEDIAADYYLDTTNGAIDLEEMNAGVLELHTTNGGISLSGVTADSIDAETTNGLVAGTITTPISNLRTTNGAIEITLSETSGTHELRTTNGVIDITTPTGSSIGYKVDLDTSIGGLDVNLPNMDYSVNTVRSKIGETTGYASKTTKITITAETTIGAININ